MAISKSKKELEEENKLLREKLKEFVVEKKKVEEHSGDLPEIGLGVIKEDDLYKIVELRFNPVTKEAKVIRKIIPSQNPRDFSMGVWEAKKFLNETLLRKVNEYNN